MMLSGRAHKFGDEINTDIHISAKYRAPGVRMEQLVASMLAQLDQDFAQRRRPGDFIVAGEHFGTVSSREDAAEVIKLAGISAVLAKSFGHMFYRNAINLGLWVIEADTTEIETGDQILIDTDSGKFENVNKGYVKNFLPVTKDIQEIIDYGGLLNYLKVKNSFPG